MQIEIQIDSSHREPKIIIVTDRLTEEVHQIMKKLEEPTVLSGFKENTLTILEQQCILRIYAAGGKIFAVTEEGEYTLRLRLYELEERLDPSSFVRISNSEIINLKRVKNFDLSFSGTICAALSDGTTSYVSRRYVAKIKKILGIGG